jgi:uncharacterized protein
MTAREIIANAARRLDAMFPGYFPQAKHNHYRDFGYPEHLTFAQIYAMYQRNGFARAGIDKTIGKTWQDMPALWETEKPTESALEADIRQRFADLRIWQRLAETDRRSMVGGYAGAILRFADSKRFQEPVNNVPGGLAGLVEVIPAWAGQLSVSSWDTDETSENYGQPTMYSFNEAEIPSAATNSNTETRTRSFQLHPDRVILWSTDGTVHAESALAPGYNDLLTMEKVAGAGGEGFWKNAKSAPILSIDKDARLEEMAQAMGVAPDAVADAMNDQVEDWQKGFDRLLMLQGMKAETLGITLPSPEHFFNVALQGYAASLNIPLKILVGNQTGERASMEDAKDWAQVNMSRRDNLVRPNILEFVNRLERVGILPERDYTIGWTDLTESSASEKLDRAIKMAEINNKAVSGPLAGETVFTGPEIREAVGYEPLTDDERFGETPEFGDVA